MTTTSSGTYYYDIEMDTRTAIGYTTSDYPPPDPAVVAAGIARWHARLASLENTTAAPLTEEEVNGYRLARMRQLAQDMHDAWGRK